MTDLSGDVDAIRQALRAEAEVLCAAIEDRVREKLSGAVLQQRSGALARSIQSSIDDDGAGLSASVASVGVPYAAIQEYGGKTAAHDIVATKAQALAFVMSGNTVFARVVHHPGSTIPAHAYLGGTLDEMQSEILGGLKQAVLGVLQG